MKKTSIHEVAKAAGTSICTVSKVMNNQFGISNATRRRVIEAANRLGYRTATGGNRTIAVIAGKDLLGAYDTEMLNALLPVFSSNGYHLEVVLEKDLDILNERAISGAIATLGSLQRIRHWQAFSALPMVSINGPGLPHAGIYSVSADANSAIQLAVGRLWRSGHRKIGYISPLSKSGEEQRYTRSYHYYCEEMRRRGINNPEQLSAFAQKSGNLSAISVLLNSGCTGAICVDGTFGIVVARTLNELGKSIPEDFSLISWEFPRVSQYLVVPQTTCMIDYHGIAVNTFKVLDALIKGKKVPDYTPVPFHLIERDSVGSPPESARIFFASELQERIYAVLSEGEMSRVELAEKLGISAGSGHLLRLLLKMRKNGQIEYTIPDRPRSCCQKLRICRYDR